MSIQRYECLGIIDKCNNGDYVLYTAHAAEVERLNEQLEDGRKLAKESYAAAVQFKSERDVAVRDRDAAVEALRSIKNGEVEVFDESEGCLVCVGMDEEEMQEIACAALTKIEGGRNA